MALTNKVVASFLDKLGLNLSKAFLASIEGITSKAKINLIEQEIVALENGNPTASIDRVLSAAGLRAGSYTLLNEKQRLGYSEYGTLFTGSEIPAKFGAAFNMSNPRVEKWLLNESSQMVTNLQETHRAVTKILLTDGFQKGKNPHSVALDLVGRIGPSGYREGGVIGLNEPQARAVTAMRNELATLDSNYFTRTRRDHRFDAFVRKHIESGKPMTQADANRIAGRYSDRLLELRGSTIGRTEALTAMNEASDESMRQAIDEEYTAEDNVERIWRHSGRPNERPGHKELNGTKITGMKDPFVNPVTGVAMMHPGDGPGSETINCRCKVEYKVDFFATEGLRLPTEKEQEQMRYGIEPPPPPPPISDREQRRQALKDNADKDKKLSVNPKPAKKEVLPEGSPKPWYQMTSAERREKSLNDLRKQFADESNGGKNEFGGLILKKKSDGPLWNTGAFLKMHDAESYEIRNADDAAAWCKANGRYNDSGGDLEFGVCLAKNNRVVDARKGLANSVPYGPELLMYGVEVRGGTYMHVHPRNAALSSADIRFATNYEFKHICAIGLDYDFKYVATDFMRPNPALMRHGGLAEFNSIRGVVAKRQEIHDELWQHARPLSEAYNLPYPAKEIYIANSIIVQEIMAQFGGYKFKYTLNGAHGDRIKEIIAALKAKGFDKQMIAYKKADLDKLKSVFFDMFGKNP